MKKSLSILMATKNGAKFLPQTLESLFREVTPDCEVIAVDDGSTDDSVKILSRHSLRCFPCEAPGGLARARNMAVEKASGEFVTFLDQDDLVVPGSFAKRVESLRAHPKEMAVCGEIKEVIDDKNDRLGDFYELSGKPRGDFLLTWEAVKQGAIPGALWLYLFRASFLRSLGPFDSQWGPICDQEFLYRVLRESSVWLRAIPVARYRIHGANSTVHWEGRHIGVNPRVKALAALLAMKYKL